MGKASEALFAPEAGDLPVQESTLIPKANRTVRARGRGRREAVNP